MPWILFHVPCPTPDGQTARDLYQKRLQNNSAERQASARSMAGWDTREGASESFRRWDIEDEPGEVAVRLEGDVGLVPAP